MARPGFIPDQRGIAALLVSSAMRSAMTAAGREVAKEATRTAPKATGAMADRYHVEPTTALVRTRRGGDQPRASGRVINDSPHAAPNEFGYTAPNGRRIPGHNTLGKLARTRRARRHR